MKPTTSLPKIMTIIISFGGILSLVFVYYFVFTNPAESALVKIVPKVITFSQNKKDVLVKSKLGLLMPARLKIPRINTNVVIIPVGITPDGSMGVPSGPLDVAWLDSSVIPGEKGSAVIDGHSGWKNGISAVFDNLYKLKKGDKISVENVAGVSVSFVVQLVKTFDPKADTVKIFSSTDGKAHLNLITCSGAWNAQKKSYSNRLVVFSDKE